MFLFFVLYHLMLSGNFFGSEIGHGIFWGLNFGPGNRCFLLFIYLFIFFFFGGGGLFEALGIFWGFDFCPHSIIHVTWNPEYLPNENAFLLLIVMTLYPGWSRNKKIVLRTHIIIKSPSEPARKCGDIKLQSSSNIKLWFKDSWRPCGNEVLRVKWTTSFPILVKRIWKLLILFGPLFCLFVIEYSALDVVSSLFQKERQLKFRDEPIVHKT